MGPLKSVKTELSQGPGPRAGLPGRHQGQGGKPRSGFLAAAPWRFHDIENLFPDFLVANILWGLIPQIVSNLTIQRPKFTERRAGRTPRGFFGKQRRSVAKHGVAQRLQPSEPRSEGDAATCAGSSPDAEVSFTVAIARSSNAIPTPRAIAKFFMRDSSANPNRDCQFE